MSLQHRVVHQRHTTNELCALLAQITTLGAPHVNPTTDQQDPLAMECFYCGHWMTPEVIALLRKTSKGLNDAVSAFAKQYKVTVSANWFGEGGVEGVLTRVQELQKLRYVCDKLEPLRETLTSFTMNNVRFHYAEHVWLLLDALKKCTKLQHLDLSHTNLFSVTEHDHRASTRQLLADLDTISKGMDSLVYLNLSDTGLHGGVFNFVENLPRNGPLPHDYHPDKLESNVGRPLSVYINDNGDYCGDDRPRSFNRRIAKSLEAITVNGHFNLFFDSRPMHSIINASGKKYVLDSSDDEDNGSDISW